MKRAAAALVLPVLASASVTIAAPGPPAAAFPARLEEYLSRYVRLGSDGRQRLLAGSPITKLLDSDPSKEVVVFGAVWIDAPVARYLEAVKDIETMESGDNFHVTKKVSAPPRLEDFARLVIPKDDADDLRSCRVADCQIKLSQRAIDRVRRRRRWSNDNRHRSMSFNVQS